MQQRVRGESPGRLSEGAWPDLSPTLNEAAWDATRQRLWNALSAMRSHIAETPPNAMLDQGSVSYSQFADLLCRFIHNAYHIGQIIKLREWKAFKS